MKHNLSVAAGLVALLSTFAGGRPVPIDHSPDWPLSRKVLRKKSQRGQRKTRVENRRSPAKFLDAYEKRYTHLLTHYVTEKNRARLAQRRRA